MFSVEEREHIRESLIERARSDPRIVAAAAVGSSAGEGDRWSDLDLTFGVVDRMPVDTVLTDWTEAFQTEFNAAVLFDVPVRSTIYRVFLLPGTLQVDLSFSPAAEFGARGPRFQLLFGEAKPYHQSPATPAESIFGLAVHHAVRAQICIERGRLWQAEYWIHDLRDQALTLACLHRSLETSHGRGFDRLPPEVLDPLAEALPHSVTADDLRRALAAATAGLLREADDILAAEPSWLRAELERIGDGGSDSSQGGTDYPVTGDAQLQ